MSESVARDPVFGEVARALRPIASSESAQAIRGPYPIPANLLRDVGWSQVRIRTAALDLEHRRRLEGLRALTQLEDGWSLVACPRFALAELDPSSQIVRALLAAHDHAVRSPAEPRILGIVNVTPDSFSDGGRYQGEHAAAEHGLALAAAGADLLDVGGESTRPGASAVSEDLELRRVIPVVRALARAAPRVPLSIDTTKSAVARAALDEGATIVNDISAGRADPRMLPLVADRRATFVAMHMQGSPIDMQAAPRYVDVVSEVIEFLRERVAFCLEAGIARERVWIDPGIGFGKTVEHNLELLRSLSDLRSLGLPVLLGPSRKSFIAALHPPAREDSTRVGGTAAAVALGVVAGVDVFRVHDVGVMREAIAVARAILADGRAARGSPGEVPRSD